MCDDELEPAAWLIWDEENEKIHTFVHSEKLADTFREAGWAEVTPLVRRDRVLELLEERIDDLESDKEEIEECDIENCQYDMDERNHRQNELLVIGQKMELERLREQLAIADDVGGVGGSAQEHGEVDTSCPCCGEDMEYHDMGQYNCHNCDISIGYYPKAESNWELHDFLGDKADMKWSPADWREAENAVQSGDKEKLEEAAPGVNGA